MSDTYDFLSQVNPDMVKSQVEKYNELYSEMVNCEAMFTKAKNAFEAYARTTLPQALKAMGLESYTSTDGTRIDIKTKATCSLKKDESLREEVARWLESNGMGHLVKSKFYVSEDNLDQIQQMGIDTFKEVIMNTVSVKAYLMGALGLKKGGGEPTLTKEDIPNGISFYYWDEAVIHE